METMRKMTKEETRAVVRKMLDEYEGDDYYQLVEAMKEAINLIRDEKG